MNNYEDIINLDRPISKHKHLDTYSRAAQFAPFSALVGYDGQIKEASRLTDKRIDEYDELREILNYKLNYIDTYIKERIPVSITYFIKDKNKDGGKYITIKTIIKKVDSINEIIKLENNIIISMNDIIDIESEVFNLIQ